MSDSAASPGSSNLRPQQDGEEQQHSPHEVPSSPHLRPRAHRSASPTASSSTATTSTLAQREDAPASSSQSPESSGSSSSRGSLSERGATSHRGDLTASVISNLDLNEYMASPTLRGQVEDASSSLDEDDMLRLREVAAKRLPLVREDTSTRRAIEGLTSHSTEEQTSSPITGGSSEIPQKNDEYPHHPMFDRLEPPSASLGGPTSSSSQEPSTGAGLTALLSPDDRPEAIPAIEAQNTIRHRHHSRHRGHSSDEEPDDDDSRAAHQPKTTSGNSHVQTVPTVSSTGMPRLFHRHADDPTLQSHYGSQGAPPKELLPEGSTAGHGDASDPDSDSDSSSTTSSSSRPGSPAHKHAPTGSLILTALSPSSQISWGRRLAILSSSFFVNLGLPFINGVCLGFGEIFARTLVAPLVLGIVNSRWPHLSGGGGGTGSARGNGGVTTNVGRTRGEREELRRETGSGRGIGTAGVGVRATSSY